jgi:hypothetical protein
MLDLYLYAFFSNFSSDCLARIVASCSGVSVEVSVDVTSLKAASTLHMLYPCRRAAPTTSMT